MGDDSDASATLHQLDSSGVPCSCRLYGNGAEHVCNLAKLECLYILRCAAWLAAASGVTRVLAVWHSAYVRVCMPTICLWATGAQW